MKKLLISILLSFSIGARAQTWDEFFRQKATQRKYLLQQIAALKVYADYLSKGYDIANKGLKTIKGFTKGEFDLHTGFFNSLKTVNPIVANNKKLEEIVKWQAAIIKAFGYSMPKGFSPEDSSYFQAIKTKILKECSNDAEEVLLVISSGKLEMRDDERLKRIDKLHLQMQDKLQFTESFLTQLKTLALQREQEEKSIQKSKELYQITN